MSCQANGQNRRLHDKAVMMRAGVVARIQDVRLQSGVLAFFEIFHKVAVVYHSPPLFFLKTLCHYTTTHVL